MGEAKRHLCNTCKSIFPECDAEKIVWGLDLDPTAKGAEADRVDQCDKYQEEKERTGAMFPGPERLKKVLEFTFKGIHHCGPIHKYLEGTGFEYWETSKYSGRECFESTWDFNFLTRFIFACHAFCVRGGIGPSGPGMIKLQIRARYTRVGLITERHPDMEDAINGLRGPDKSDWAFEEEKGGE